MTLKTKNLFIILIATLLFTGLAPQAYADTINPSQHFMDHCFQVANISAYPEYTFISRTFTNRLAGEIWTNKVISRSSCSKFDREVSQLQICATKNKFDVQTIPDSFIKSIACSKVLELQSISALPNSNPTQKITDVLSIDKVTDADLQIRKLKVVYNYKDGTVEELPYTNQDVRPVSSRAITGVLLDKLLWYGLPAGALLAILLIVIRKRRPA